MIITCKSCKTSYNLDNEVLLKSTSPKVRCSNCRYIFFVYPQGGKMKPDLSANFGRKIESWKITSRKEFYETVTKTSLEANKARKSLVVTPIKSSKSVLTINITKDKSDDLPISHDNIDVNDILAEKKGRSEIIDEFGYNEGRDLQPIVNFVMSEYTDLSEMSNLEKITKFNNAIVSDKNIEGKQTFSVKRKGKITCINSMKRKPKTKIWIPAVTSILILVILILGCYRKMSQSGNPYFVDKSEHSMTLLEKDKTKFGASVKVIDGEAESHYKMALYFQRQKKDKLAIEELKKAVLHSPFFAKAYNAMGVSYDNLGRYSQAINCYQIALKLDPKLDYVYNNLGYSFLLKNELDEAIATFQKAIEEDGNNKRYRNNLGLAYVMKEQYDKAYEQFRIIEDDRGVKEKLTKLLDQLGKEPDQYIANDSNLEQNRKKTSGREKPVVIRRKIDADTPYSLIKTDTSAQKQIESEIEDSQFSSSDNKAYLNADKDKALLDETQSGTIHSHVALTKNPEIAEPKKVKSLKNTEKERHRELKTESYQPDGPVPSEFYGKDNTESDRREEDTNPDQMFDMEYRKPSAEKKTEIYNVDESSASSNQSYDLSMAKLVSESASEKKLAAGFFKAKQSVYENFNDAQNDVTPNVIETDEPYYPNTEKAASAIPVETTEVQEPLIETNQKVSKEKQVSTQAKTASSVKSTDKKIDRKLSQKILTQQEEALSLDVKETDLDEHFKSEETIVEVEIEVANGNGINGVAAKFGSYLNSKGFKVTKVTNANSFDHTTTKILYCDGNINSVYKLLEQISLVLDQRSIIKLKNTGNRIKIIIGKDMACSGDCGNELETR